MNTDGVGDFGMGANDKGDGTWEGPCSVLGVSVPSEGAFGGADGGKGAFETMGVVGFKLGEGLVVSCTQFQDEEERGIEAASPGMLSEVVSPSVGELRGGGGG